MLWLLTVPMDFSGNDVVLGNFKLGVFLFGVCVILENLAKKAEHNWFTVSAKMFFILVGTILSSGVFYFLMPVFAFIKTYSISAFLPYLILLMIFIIVPAVKIIRVIRYQFRWINIFLLVSLIPVLFGNIIFITTFSPNKYATAKHKDTKYYLVSGRTFDHYDAFVNAYRCSSIFSCTKIFAEWSWTFPELIVVDNLNDEVHFVMNEPYPRIFFTDAERPRWYEGVGRKNDDSFFTFTVENDDCGEEDICLSKIITIYKCGLDFTSCSPLAIRFLYEDVDSEFPDLGLDVDEKAINLVLYEDGNQTIIFSYGSDIKCFDERCLVLSE